MPAAVRAASNALEQLIGMEQKAAKEAPPFEPLTAKQLAARKIEPLTGAGLEDRYTVLTSNILDKVRLTISS